MGACTKGTWSKKNLDAALGVVGTELEYFPDNLHDYEPSLALIKYLGVDGAMSPGQV